MLAATQAVAALAPGPHPEPALREVAAAIAAIVPRDVSSDRVARLVARLGTQMPPLLLEYRVRRLGGLPDERDEQRRVAAWQRGAPARGGGGSYGRQ